MTPPLLELVGGEAGGDVVVLLGGSVVLVFLLFVVLLSGVCEGVEGGAVVLREG